MFPGSAPAAPAQEPGEQEMAQGVVAVAAVRGAAFGAQRPRESPHELRIGRIALGREVREPEEPPPPLHLA
jgi:hypothetical protein